MRKASNVKEVLTAAEWILTHVGWTQGTFYRNKKGFVIHGARNIDDLGSVCLVGAIHLVRATNDNFKEKAYLHINNSIDDKYHDVMAFNDAPERKVEEVLALVRKAIETA